jgi:beta-ribofuranosylaminobenzene 5'-phosphate synthase
MKVTVTTSARLHFGFIDLDGSLGRRFGSIGLVINEPRLVLEATQADRLVIEGDGTGRARELARRFLRHHRISGGAHIVLKEVIPSHVGLGSGTQLALSIATALARLFSIDGTVRDHASVMGRGVRSGVGLAAFEYGGFIVDGGRKVAEGGRRADPAELPAPIFRHPFPDDWMFVVALPGTRPGLTGGAEEEAFHRLWSRPAPRATTLSRIVLVQMLPALMERDAETFGRALTSVQRIVGNWFRAVQGGAFGSPIGETVTKAMTKAGALGVGQSSWGPAVYGLAADERTADTLEQTARRVLSGRAEAIVFRARANNRGADVVSADTVWARQRFRNSLA